MAYLSTFKVHREKDVSFHSNTLSQQSFLVMFTYNPHRSFPSIQEANKLYFEMDIHKTCTFICQD